MNRSNSKDSKRTLGYLIERIQNKAKPQESMGGGDQAVFYSFLNTNLGPLMEP